MKIKIEKSDVKTNAFGGLIFIHDWIVKSGIPEIIDETLGQRPKQAKYSYSDVIISFVLNLFAGAKRLEHSYNFKKDLDTIEGVTIPSPDTTGRIFKQLAVSKMEIPYGDANKTHVISRNIPLTSVILKTIKKLKLVSNDTINVIDYDNTIIPTKKYDATKSYKIYEGNHLVGYQPAIANLNGFPVYVEGRNGHTNASFGVTEALDVIVRNCASSNIRVHRYRADSASYNRSLFRYCDANKIEFFIRGKITNKVSSQIKKLEESDWKTRNGKVVADFTSLPFEFKETKETYRAVIQRVKFKDKFSYSCILTNNWGMDSREVNHFYNMRGAEEKRFAELKREFNITSIPFSFIEENTSFMYLCCLAYNLYKKILEKVEIKPLHFNSWLKIFRRHFIFHTAIVTQEIRQYKLTSTTDEVMNMYRNFMEGF